MEATSAPSGDADVIEESSPEGTSEEVYLGEFNARHEALPRILHEQIPLDLLKALEDLEYPTWMSDQSMGEHRRHYFRLAEEMQRRFGDPILTKAALVRGIGSGRLAALQDYLGSEVMGVLKEYEHLRRLNLDQPGIEFDLRQKILPDIRDVRSIALLVYDRIDRFDPSGHLREWLKDFREKPPAEIPSLEKPADSELESEEAIFEFATKIVAPAAEHFGMWQERNLIRSAVLYFSRRDRFLELADFAHKAHNEGWIDAFVREVGQIWEKRGADKIVYLHWEWRNVASLDEQFRELKYAQWRRKGHLAGFVTVVCRSIDSCYGLLGKAHCTRGFRQRFFRDAIGKPTASGYRALHTVLEGSQKKERLVSVRFIPLESNGERITYIGRKFFVKSAEEQSGRRSDEIQIFTKNGSYRYLQSGATILDLALVLEPIWVAYLAKATVNGRPVGVTSQLSDGESVELDLRSEKRPLPPNWRSQVLPESVQQIEAGLREAYLPDLESRVRKGLSEAAQVEVEDAGLLRIFVESGIADYLEVSEDPIEESVEWWICELGLWLWGQERRELPFEKRLKDLDAVDVFEKVTARAERLRVWRNVLDVGRGEVQKAVVRACPQCKPGPSSSLASEIRDGVIEIHRRGAKCARGAAPILRKHYSLDQYFVIELESRPGMARDIAAVFGGRNVNVVEFLARQLGSSWGVVRVELEPTGPKLIEALESDLQKTPGVSRIFSPGEEAPAILLNALPPRPEVQRSPLSRPAPFICGPVIYEDQYFYGRRHELATLRQYVDRAGSRRSPGLRAFVSGALKVGKTSLVQYFQRYLETQHYGGRLHYINLYHKAATEETWEQVEKVLLASFREKLGGLPADEYKSLIGSEKNEPYNFGELLKRFTERDEHPTVVIAIDEVVRLFKQAHQSNEWGQIQKFNQLIESTPGLLLIWIGPIAPLRYLDDEYVDILTSSEQLQIKALGEDDVREMLQAGKMAPIHRFEVPGATVKEVARITGGNPFWIAHLGHEMWSHVQKREPARQKIRFNKRLVGKASRELVQLETPFQGRILPSGYHRPQDQLMLAAMFALAELATTDEEKEFGSAMATSPEISNFIDVKGVDANSGELGASLHELLARGGVNKLSAREVYGPARWQIAVPLLADYIRHLLESLGWGVLLEGDRS